MPISGPETQSSSTKVNPSAETQSVRCDSCDFTEECTPAYILRVRERHQGRWICGLCVEAVKDEVHRSDTAISTAEALNRHISFCEEFRTSFPPAKTEYPIIAISKLFRRRRDSLQVYRSNSSSSLATLEGVQTPPLLRSGSCFPALPSCHLKEMEEWGINENGSAFAGTKMMTENESAEKIPRNK